jgi:hypothetical protein
MSVSLSLAKEIWSELSQYIDESDLTDAAEAVLAAMIDNDIVASEIREAFKNDEWMSDAVTTYLKDDHLPMEMEYEDDWLDDDYDDEIHEEY